MTLRYAFLSCILLLPFFVQGQPKEYRLNGYAYIKNGVTCRYDVEFTVSGTAISGNSITSQPDGRELKAMITGNIDRKNQALSFIESKMPLIVNVEDCMFDVKLTYKLMDGQYIFSGSFTGKNNQHNFCDEGTIRLETKKEHCSPFDAERPKKKPVPKTEAGPAVSVGTPHEFTKITSAIRKEFEWISDTCIMEIWDGEVVDGDIVTISLNGKKVLQSYSLTADKKQIMLPIAGRINTITILAENEGKAPPNTSMISLSDGTVQHGLLACLKEGETTEIILKKKAGTKAGR